MYRILFFLLALAFFSCGDKNDDIDRKGDGSFQWKETLTLDDIPDSPVKGMLNGTEVNFEYINFEQWRGSGDNVINFSDKKPNQNCGYVENDNAFHLMRKSGDIGVGELLKESFSSNLDGFVGDYHFFKEGDIETVDVQWNCALIITDINEKTVTGKIAMCFNDEKKSWIAGTFEAIRCSN